MSPTADRRLPDLVAHRGWATRAPENTLAALRAAADAGIGWLEVDVQLSADGVPFLFHDRTLERLCGVEGPLGARTAAELGALRAAQRGRFGERFAEEPIAPLADLVALLAARPALRAFVEIKRAALERHGFARVLEQVRAVLEPVRERCTWISFSYDFLVHARAAGVEALGPVLERWEDRADPRVAGLRAAVVFADREILPPAGALDERALGAPLAVYEVPDAAEALALAARGVRFVETFAVGELAQALSEPRARA